MDEQVKIESEERQLMRTTAKVLRVMSEKAKQVSDNSAMPNALRWRMLGQSEAFTIAAWILSTQADDIGSGPPVGVRDMGEAFGSVVQMVSNLAGKNGGEA